MVNLGRRVSYLFWQHPILWLPLLCVDFAAYWLRYFQKLWTHQLFLWLLPRASVFSHDPAPLRPGNNWSIVASSITLPIVWVTLYLILYLYVAAFIATSQCVQSLTHAISPSTQLAFNQIRSKQRPILLFCLTVLILFPMAGLLATTPYLSRNFPLVSYTPFVQTEILGTVTFAAAGFLMGPSALKLIQPLHCEPIPPGTKMQARIFTALAVAATMILGATVPTVEQSIYNGFSTNSQVFSTSLSITGSLIATFPYIALSIALSLLATNEPQEPPTILEDPAEME